VSFVSIYEGKTHFSELVARAEGGEEIVVTRHGRPVARIAPLGAPSGPRRLGSLKGRLWIADDFDEFAEQDERDWYGA
jgi:prevent-host-death family protein